MTTLTLDPVTAAPPALRDLDDDGLRDRYLAAADDTELAAILGEARRRDRDDRKSNADNALRYEWYDAMHAQRMAAEAFCGGGGMLNREGLRRQVSEWDMWTGPQTAIDRYGSEDLIWYFTHIQPRLTFTEYKRQRHQAGRIQREEWRDRDQISNGGNDHDDHDRDGTARPRLAGPDTGSLRHAAPAAQAPQAGPRRDVHGGGSHPFGAEDSSERDAGAGSGGSGGTVPPVAREDGDDMNEDDSSTTPIRLPGVTILDEIEAFISRHVQLPAPHNARVMALMAGASYVTPLFPATFRGLFAGLPNSGKTTAMNITADMSNNPTDLSGTEPYARSAIIGAANTPELGYPTFVLDDMKLFGDSGMNQSRDLRADVMRRGYKNGATTGVSRSQVDKKINVFAPFLMSGLEAIVQGDIRTRCIILWHEEGLAEQYYDLRYAVRLARDYGKSLKEAVGVAWEELTGFQGDGYHPKMTGRYLEVWEPLLAVAKCIGGQKWVNYCIEAFTALTGNGTTVRQLTPRQKVIRDVIAVMDGPLAWADGQGFIPGDLLAPELRQLNGDEYKGMNDNALLQHVAANMAGIGKRQVAGLSRKGYPLDRMMGYLARDIRAEWDEIRPVDPSDVEALETASPYEPDGEDDGDLDDLLQGVQGVQEVPSLAEVAR